MQTTNIFTFKTKNFTVIVDAQEETMPIDHCDTEQETARIYRRIENGELVYFCAHAYVLDQYGNEIADDYLGGCLYKDFADFMDHKGIGLFAQERKLKRARSPKRKAELAGIIAKIEKRGYCYGSYFSQIVKQVCRDAREHLNNLQPVKMRA